MEKSTENRVSYRILVDARHGTYYCIEPNGKSYIEKSTQKEFLRNGQTNNHI